MNIWFFIFLTISIAVGVYLGNHPKSVLLNLEEIRGWLKFLVWVVFWGIVFIVADSVFTYLNNTTTVPVWNFLIPIGAFLIAWIVTIYVYLKFSKDSE